MHNAIVTLVYYSVMQYTCSFFVLKHGLTTAHYCAIMLTFSQFKMHPNIAVIMTGLQSVWLRNHLPVSARNKEIFLQNVLTGSGTAGRILNFHPAGVGHVLLTTIKANFLDQQ